MSGEMKLLAILNYSMSHIQEIEKYNKIKKNESKTKSKKRNR